MINCRVINFVNFIENLDPALPFPFDVSVSEGEYITGLFCVEPVLSGEPRSRFYTSIAMERKGIIAARCWLDREQPLMFLVSTMLRVIAGMGKVLVREGQMSMSMGPALRLNMLDLALSWTQQTFAVDA